MHYTWMSALIVRFPARVLERPDARHGYCQIPLDETSQLLTTFNTPFGRWCFTRMPFGIKSAQEVFQKRISQQFDDLEGVATDIDDILIWGSSEQEQHDQRLEAAVQICEKINLTLNEEKCEFNVGEVCYCGHYFTKDVVKPDVSKIRAIQEMPAPSTKKDVERLLTRNCKLFGKVRAKPVLCHRPNQRIVKKGH